MAECYFYCAFAVENSGHKSLYLKNVQYIIRCLLLSTIMPLSSEKILAFDTSSPRGSIAFLEGRDLRAEMRLNTIQTHSAFLLSSMDYLAGKIGWQLNELNLIAAGIGPGSFTGIRIGVATALGIAQSLAIPFAGISGLDALAHQALWPEGRMGVVLNAHRSQVFYAEYISSQGKLRTVQKSSLMFLSDLERRLAHRHLYIIGDVELRYPGGDWPRLLPVDLFLAASIGRLAISRKRSWRSGSYLLAEPLYIRPPDALRKKSKTV
jgi:tRNA threonylcarbamoyladenosine biosynthesis protein TsaB